MITTSLLAIKQCIDSGISNGKIRIYTAPKPLSPMDTPTGVQLVEIILTKPCGNISTNTLYLTQQSDSIIMASGVASWARILNSDNLPILDMDCSDANGTGDLKLSETILYAGGYISLLSCAIGV